MRASDIIGKFRFRRTSDSGGGVSDEVKGYAIDLKMQFGQSWSGQGYNPYPLSSYSIRIPIDENNCIDAYRVYGKTQGLRIVKVVLDGTTLRISSPNTLDLNLGENTTTDMLTAKEVKVADDKSFVIFGVSQVNKFFYVPLNKVDDSYTFGTPISLDLDIAPRELVIMDANTFVIHQWSDSHKLAIIKLSNGSLSIERTINEQQINAMGKIGDKLVITSDLKFAVYDVSTGERIYKANSGSVNNFIVIENKAVSFSGSSGIEINGETITYFELTKDSNAGYYTYILAEKVNDNEYVIICGPSTSYKELFAFKFDYQNNSISHTVKIMNNLLVPTNTDSVLVKLVGTLILGYIHSSDAFVYDSEIIKDKIISLKYKNDTYEISSIGE